MTPTRALLCVVSGLCLTAGARAQLTAHHRFAFAVGDTSARVTVRVSGRLAAVLTVGMPAWQPTFTPGVRPTRAPTDWQLRATSDASPLVVESRTAGRWSVQTAGATAITLHYEVPITGRKLPSGLGQRNPHTFRRPGAKAAEPETIRYHESFVIRGGSTWLDIQGAMHRVTFDVPAGFRVATVLPRSDDGSYAAATYPALIATPMHVGKFEVSSFTVDGIPHRLVLSGFSRERTDRTQFAATLTKIVRANQQAMGKLPYSNYVFLFGRQAGQPDGIGHGQCTEIVTSQLRISPTLVRRLAHAHLAAWHGRFFRPLAWKRAPTDEGLTAEAWFWLGAREYLTELALVRAGFAKPEAFWTRTVAAKINRLQLDARRLKTIVAETGARIRTPNEVIRPGAPHPRLIGFLLCLLLDVEIRANTGGKMSIDDAIRGLAAQCREQKRGYSRHDIREWCAKVGGRKFHHILSCVTTSQELPLTATLAKIGVEARPSVRPRAKAPRSKRAPKPRRRAPRWRVSLPADAAAAALRLRAGMTGGV